MYTYNDISSYLNSFYFIKLDEVEDCFINLPGNVEKNEKEISFCGNWKVDPGEACDCGPEPETCNDDCCYPAHVRSQTFIHSG
jgi:hypothetical protein